jgi:hypothetical protein
MGKIIPTNGRVMLYWPSVYDRANGVVQHSPGVALTAHVCHVWGEHMVNVDVIDSEANHHKRTSVPVIQDESPFEASANSPYVTWMDYQLGQAAKHEALEKKIEAERAELAKAKAELAAAEGGESLDDTPMAPNGGAHGL